MESDPQPTTDTSESATESFDEFSIFDKPIRLTEDFFNDASVSKDEDSDRLPPQPKSLDLPPKYKATGKPWSGGMGDVYPAREIKVGRDVAVKLVRLSDNTDGQILDRFRLEASAIAKLDHPGIVRLLEFGEYSGRPYFTMELVIGGTLADKLDGQPRDPMQTAKLIVQVCQAISHAHQHRVIHRDLKPQNVLFSSESLLKVADFGLAKLVEADSNYTLTNEVMGTACYMAPEQARDSSNVSYAADVYALGAMLYELLVGRPPLQGQNTMETLLLLATREPEPPRKLVPSIPIDLEVLCLAALEKDDKRRNLTATEFAEELNRFIDGIPIKRRAPGFLERQFKRCRRHPAIASLSILLALSLTSAFVILLVSLRSLTAKQLEIVSKQSEIIESQANSLLNSDPNSVEKLIESFGPNRVDIAEHLKPREDELKDPIQKARLLILQLQRDPTAASRLVALIGEAGDPSETELIAQQLKAARAAAVGSGRDATWREIELEVWSQVNSEFSSEADLHRAVVLSHLAPQSPSWQSGSAGGPLHQLTNVLVERDSVEALEWMARIRPIHSSLSAILGKALNSESDRTRRLNLARLLASSVRSPQRLVEQMLTATPTDFPPLMSALKRSQISPAMHRELVSTLTAVTREGLEPWPELQDGLQYHRDRGLQRPDKGIAREELQREAQAKRVANAAALLLALAEVDVIGPLLVKTRDDRIRSLVIDRLALSGVSPIEFFRRFVSTRDNPENRPPSVQRAAILALGQFLPSSFGRAGRIECEEWLMNAYVAHLDDAGTHAAVEWLLRHWGKSDFIDEKTKELSKEWRSHFKSACKGKRKWYINSNGHTMIVLDVGTFAMGAHQYTVAQENDEDYVTRNVGRRIAMSSHEATIAQVRPYFQSKGIIGNDGEYSGQYPVHRSSWYITTGYCNWLSIREEMPSVSYIIGDNKRKGWFLRDSFGHLPAYRLPTEAEWEYACRAGSDTKYAFGQSSGMLERYARWVENSNERLSIVGTYKPNDFGFFDMHGNTDEWCDYIYRPSYSNYQSANDFRGLISDDILPVDLGDVTEKQERVLRGGSFRSTSKRLRSMHRRMTSTDNDDEANGVRIVTTLPALLSE